MAQRKITRDDVINYLKRLPVDQPIPVLRDIRADLGGGSLATISAGVNAFLEERAYAPIAEHAMPIAFEQAGRDLIDKLWNIAAKKISDSENFTREELKGQIEVVRKNSEALQKKVEDLEEVVQQKDDKNASLTVEREELKIQLAKLSGEADALRKQIADLSAALQAERAAREAAEKAAAAAEAARDAESTAAEKAIQALKETLS